MTADIVSSPREATTSQAYAGTLDHLYQRAAASFAVSTPSNKEQKSLQRYPDQRTPVSTVADPEVIAELADAPELRAIEELRSWLQLSYQDVAVVAGLKSASLLHHWRQRYKTGNPVRTRASTVEQLWRVHSLVRAVAEALEGAGQSYAVQLWSRRREAGITPLELLLRGEVDDVEQRARQLLFDHRTRPIPPSRRAALEPSEELQTVKRRAATYEDSDFG